MNAKTFDPIWEEIYSSGQQLNKYPYTSVVSFLFRNYPEDKKRKNTSILEIGCGAGNNLWFAAKEGFKVTGLDASNSAIEFAKKRFEEDNLYGEFIVGDFTDLPFTGPKFDIVIDRGALTQAGRSAAKNAVDEVYRVLNDNGIFYSEPFSDRATSRGEKIDDGLMINIEGPYSTYGQMCFYSKSQIEDLFKDCWKIQDLRHIEEIQVFNKPYEVFAHWSITAKKISDD